MAERKGNPQDDPVIDDALSAEIASGIAPVRQDAEGATTLRDRVMARAFAEAPPLTRTVRADEGDWIRVSDLVDIKVLRRDVPSNTQTLLFRMKPGGVIVAHPHNQEEECMVLEGEIAIGDYRLRKGDMHIAAPGARHGEIRTVSGALLMIRSEIPPAHFKMV